MQIGRQNKKRKPVKKRDPRTPTVGRTDDLPNGRRVGSIEARLRDQPCWGEMLDLMAIGTSVTDLVHFAKTERLCYQDISSQTLEKYLHWFLEGRSKEYIQSRCPSKIKLYEQSMFDFDVWVAHKMLAAIQFERVTSAVDKEKEIKETENNLKEEEKSKVRKSLVAATNDATRQIGLLNTILKTLNDSEIQRNTKRTTQRFFHSAGMDQNGNSVVQAVEKVKEQYQQKWGENTAKVILDPESRRKLLNVIERVRAGNSPAVQKALKAHEKIKKQTEGYDDDEEETTLEASTVPDASTPSE